MSAGARLASAAALALGLSTAGGAASEPAAPAPARRALYTGVALVANVTPVVSTIFAPRCLPGYVLCKALFAGASVVAAGGQLVLSGGSDLAQTRAILYRGFAGDWFLTARHTAGEVTPQPFPDPPAAPAEQEGTGAWEPPPL